MEKVYENPFIIERADPYIMKSPDGYYYFTASYPMKSGDDPDGYDRIVLRRANSMEGLACAEEKVIWKAQDTSLTHRFIWAPELHLINGKWYVLYAGSNSTDTYWNIDCSLLECQGDNPYENKWMERGKFEGMQEDNFSFRGFSLDMTYFECGGHSYVIWAQQSPFYKISTLYMAEINPQNPRVLISKPMRLSEPQYAWEKERYPVNEGPAVLKHEGKVYVCFSASGTGPEYCVGLLEADAESDLMSPQSWKKYDKPLLSTSDLQDEYGPGHNSFVKNEKGEDLMVYHARSRECFEKKCGYENNDPLFDPCRHTRIRRVEWKEHDGFPFRIK